MNIYACIINIQVPHEVEKQRAIAMRTSQIMKYGKGVIIQITGIKSLCLSQRLLVLHKILTFFFVLFMYV